MSNEAAVEKEIQDKGLTAPRLTPALIDAVIIGEAYFHPASDGRFNDGIDLERTVFDPALEHLAIKSLSCLTICILVLRNGFTVVGKSACASPENFNAELGRKIARDDARSQIWALEGYALKSRLAESSGA